MTGAHHEPAGNTPALSLRRAARQAALSIDAFKRAADALNDTPNDLRAGGPSTPVRYDAARLAHWLRAQTRPNDTTSTSSPSAPIPVAALWTNSQWELTAADYGVSTTGERLITAKRRITQQLAAASGKKPADCEIEISYNIAHPGMKAWQESVDLKDQGTRLLEAAARKRREAIRTLTAQGITGPELAAAFGLSHQRVQQLQTPTKGTAFSALLDAE
ncbi:hypothetical protein J3A64_004826 [Pseudarthrobacter sp. PvP004]|uniref:hypothetical protein n=1 Tax=Pseudarthrobacter sp. PvP004 TaxID=2817850 RepID=UPI001AE9DE83|nr:hypothetical protein [Pseudarthrobacter sp. PvP004]MBP2269286.1 hypothetical protein [Pseudarthrobacter sp. PvP004]